MQVRSLGWEDPLEEEMATHSSILFWKLSWMEEPGTLCSPWGHKELDTTKQLHSLLPSDVLLTFFTLILTSYEFFWRGVVFTRSKIQKVQMCVVNSHLPPPPAPSLETGLMIFQGQQATAQYCGLRSCPGISSNANSNQTSCVTLWVACFLSLSYLICKTLHVRR